MTSHNFIYTSFLFDDKVENSLEKFLRAQPFSAASRVDFSCAQTNAYKHLLYYIIHYNTLNYIIYYNIYYNNIIYCIYYVIICICYAFWVRVWSK